MRRYSTCTMYQLSNLKQTISPQNKCVLLIPYDNGTKFDRLIQNHNNSHTISSLLIKYVLLRLTYHSITICSTSCRRYFIQSSSTAINDCCSIFCKCELYVCFTIDIVCTVCMILEWSLLCAI